MATNLISCELDPKLLAEIQTKIAELHKLLDFTLVLSPEERAVMPVMGDKSVAFVEKSLEMAKKHTHLLPPYLDVPELQRDFNTAKTLTPLINDLEILKAKINDTALAAGSEAYSAALTFYATVKAARKNNASGAESIYNELKERFPGRPKAGKNA